MHAGGKVSVALFAWSLVYDQAEGDGLSRDSWIKSLHACVCMVGGLYEYGDGMYLQMCFSNQSWCSSDGSDDALRRLLYCGRKFE